ncbi:hypothetical protein M0813_20075 [Anaeramoeba flamelloides]|uniref:Ribosomal protein S18 n=1 Tax=Anaeramoeba flamelloides TaxID=1746091 RepID=A0ABQ8YM59_9EUKA|nr:hypothetical protein M0813_20075 [Anaeramoeba flamelloides]
MTCSTRPTTYQNEGMVSYFPIPFTDLTELGFNYERKRSFKDLQQIEFPKRSLLRSFTGKTSRKKNDQKKLNTHKKTRKIKKSKKCVGSVSQKQDRNRFLNLFQPKTKDFFLQSNNLETLVSQIKSKKKFTTNRNQNKKTNSNKKRDCSNFKRIRKGKTKTTPKLKPNTNTNTKRNTKIKTNNPENGLGTIPKTELIFKHQNVQTDFILPTVKYLWLIRKIKNSATVN